MLIAGREKEEAIVIFHKYIAPNPGNTTNPAIKQVTMNTASSNPLKPEICIILAFFLIGAHPF